VAEQVGQPATETDALRLRWVKSSASSSGTDSDCVEVATTLGRVFLRDSKSPRPILSFSREAWDVFRAMHS
jgi:hypothetical protein